MSAGDKSWEMLRLYDGGLDLRICREVSALEVARELLCSTPVTKRAFIRGQLSCQGKALLRTDWLAKGACVTLTFWREAPTNLMLPDDVPGDMPVEILYRDPVLLAADKPADLLVHGDGTDAPTLTQRVRATLAKQGSHAVAQAVQRLDMDTTGVVLFSLTEEFQPALDALVAGREMRKRYLAVVSGELPSGPCDGEGWLVLDGPIARDRHDARKMRVGRTGKPACTRVRTLATHEGLTLVLAELDTGRRHQIRVHLSHAGCPIVGDPLYGGKRTADGLMLHAWQEAFVHPITTTPIRIESPLPTRFRTLFPQANELIAQL